MASGCWPIKSRMGDRKEIEKLKSAIAAIEEVAEKIGYDDSQFDNAMLDGRYLHRLSLAVDLIGECFQD